MMAWPRALGRIGCSGVLVFALGALPLSAEQDPDDSFFLGVQTHFVQGWRLEFLELFQELGVTDLRDELSWSEIESVVGRYDFSLGRSAYLQQAIDMGLQPLVLFTDTNPLYDDGQTPFSTEAQDALAAYVLRMLDAYAPGVRRIEIGNEFNSGDFVSGPFAQDRARYFANMIAAIYKAVKSKHPETEVLCTGTHSVAIGFFRSLFENGALEYCDAISLHLYREYPDLIDVELGRLRALMAEFGRELPIYVTEFGKWFDDPEEAPDFMMKMVVQMGEAGVAGAWWYALLDQPWWPNMGLYLPDTREAMPAADSFSLLQNVLLPLGRPRRIGAAPLDHIYTFGETDSAVVAWGAPARLEVDGATQYLDTRGNPVPPTTMLSDVPVIILGENLSVSVERDRDLVDVRYTFGQPPWSYHSLRPDGTVSELQYIDWEWASFLGDPWLRPMLVSHEWISGVLFDTGPHYAIERFTAPVSGEYEITASWVLPDASGDEGADIRISLNAEVLATGLVARDAFAFGPHEVALQAGDQIDFAVGPGSAAGGDAVRREITIHYAQSPGATSP